MRNRPYEENSPKRVMTYLLYIVLLFWLIIGLVLAYQYLNQSGEKTRKKGGTFVEGIFNQISYLPYIKNDGQSMFYQSFLFTPCVDYFQLQKDGLEGGACKIITQDYQNYFISLKESGIQKNRSDGKPRSLEDIFFTYENIIHQNRRDIKTLNAYSDIQVTKEENRIKVSFPNSTTDNNFFFVNAILPEHILGNAKFEDYSSIFARNPITSGCGKIEEKARDANSLIFNLMQCSDTHLGYYQIKSYPNFEKLSKAVIEEHNTTVDAYTDQVQLSGYQKVNSVKTNILTAFFNTKSKKMTVRIRRALGGLIHSKFYSEESNQFLNKYTDPLLNHFYSDGTNVQEFINRSILTSPEGRIQKADLEDSGVQELKKSIRINGVERKFVFYTTTQTEAKFPFTINFSNQFESIKITDNNGHTFTPKNYKKLEKKVTYTLERGKNFHEGLNQYTIEGSIKGKKYIIANIDIYLLPNEQNNETTEKNTDRKIRILYYNNLESNFAAKQIRNILEEAKILENFVFEQISSPEEMEAKILLGEYDILLNTINIGMKKDASKILTVNDSMINPSNYTNPKLINLLKQYNKSAAKEEILKQINAIFAQDMPMVLLGHPFEFINIKERVFTSLGRGTGLQLNEYDRRNQLYESITLQQGTKIDISKMKNGKAFINYLKERANISDLQLFPIKKSGLEKEKKPLQNGDIETNIETEENIAGRDENIENVKQEKEKKNTEQKKSEKKANTTFIDEDPFSGLLQQ